MAANTIADFLVRLGFDGKAVIKGVAQTEAALKRLKRTKIDSVKGVQDAEFKQSIKATKQRIQAEQNVNRMKDAAARKAQVERNKELAHLRSIRAQRLALLRSANMRQRDRMPDDKRDSYRARILGTRSKEQLKDINAEMRDYVVSSRKQAAEQAKSLTAANAMKFTLSSMVASVKNLARSWMSIFVVLGGALASLRITQEFQALEASMLAVSSSTEAAAENFEYIKDLATQLPVDITQAGNNFKSMLAAGAETMGEQGVQELFTAVSEFGTALQVDQVRMDRAMMAIGQMLNKGQVMARKSLILKDFFTGHVKLL